MGLAKYFGNPKPKQSRIDLQSILHENQSLVQPTWNGIADEMFPKETSNGQLDKSQLPEMQSGRRPKNSRESGTVRELDFSGRSSATHRSDTGSLKGFPERIEQRRQSGVQLSQASECPGGAARQSTCAERQRQRNRNSGPSQKPVGAHAGGNVGKTVRPKAYTF